MMMMMMKIKKKSRCSCTRSTLRFVTTPVVVDGDGARSFLFLPNDSRNSKHCLCRWLAAVTGGGFTRCAQIQRWAKKKLVFAHSSNYTKLYQSNCSGRRSSRGLLDCKTDRASSQVFPQAPQVCVYMSRFHCVWSLLASAATGKQVVADSMVKWSLAVYCIMVGVYIL